MESFGSSELLPTRSATSFRSSVGVGLPHATTANLKTENRVDDSFPGELLALYDAQRSAPDCKGYQAAARFRACKQDMKSRDVSCRSSRIQLAMKIYRYLLTEYGCQPPGIVE